MPVSVRKPIFEQMDSFAESRMEDGGALSAVTGPQSGKTTANILFIEYDREEAAAVSEALLYRGIAVKIVCTGEDAVGAILRDAPDLVLFDARSVRRSDVDLLERFMTAAPHFRNLPLVFLITRFDRIDSFLGRHLGIDDYVMDPIDFDALETTIRARTKLGPPSSKPRTVDVSLNHRQIEALTWVARGRTSVEIAAILGLAKRTVDFHLDTARKALGVATRAEAVLKASQSRLIKP